MSYSIEGVDWTKYLDRKQPLILFAAFIRPYGSLLEEATGFRFQHQLHIFSGDFGTFIKSAKELAVAEEFFLELARNNDPRLVEWRDCGLGMNAKADELILSAAPVTKENFWDTWRLCEDVMLYDTVIPFRMMVGINAATNANGGAVPEDLKHAFELFEPFRAGAKYPELVDKVFPRFYAAAASAAGIADAALLSNAAPFELKGIIEGTLRISAEELMRRKEWCAFWEEPDTGAVRFSYDKAGFEKLGLLADYSGITEVAGSPAYKGVARGTARILNNVADIKDFNEGDIIVSFNTNPSLMPALRKCGGIVTDEGGIMCHAAIISRELKRPCVIGTKIATKVFKEGDRIEVDAENGIVRILS